MKKVVIIDGLNMFLRSYIINPTMDPKGPGTNTIGTQDEDRSRTSARGATWG